MGSATLALSWQLWARHRWAPAVVVAGCLAAAGIIYLLPRGSLDSTMSVLISLQFLVAVLYVACVFAHGFESHLEVKESGFPAYLFRLPVHTSLLVGWPMLQGTAIVALLWLGWAHFVLRPAGVHLPLLLSTLMAAAFVGLLQALVWCPFGLPWARILVAIVVLPTLLLSPVIAAACAVGETELVSGLALLLPATYALTVAGVARARRGEVPDWQWLLPFTRSEWRRPVAAFRGPVQAQLWLERRRHLLSFPLLVACFTVLHMAFIIWVEQVVQNKIDLALNFLLFPVVLAPFFGCFLGRVGTSAANPYPMSSFTATRPMTSTAVVVAKIKVTLLAALLAWGVVLAAIAVTLLATGLHVRVPRWWNHLVERVPTWKIIILGFLNAVGFFLLTWKPLVDNLVFGLAGRAWIMRGSLLARGLGITLALMLLARMSDRHDFANWFWNALPWLTGSAVVCKLLLAAWAGRTLVLGGFVTAHTLAKIMALWVLAAVTIFVLLYTVVPEGVVSIPLMAFGVILCLPLARVALAPLAVDWNRHR